MVSDDEIHHSMVLAKRQIDCKMMLRRARDFAVGGFIFAGLTAAISHDRAAGIFIEGRWAARFFSSSMFILSNACFLVCVYKVNKSINLMPPFNC
jgi:hypothetical protein